MARGASLRLQAIANTAGNLAFYAVIFVLTPISIRELGDEGWGVWQLVGATTAYAGLLALGLASAIHYQVALNLARHDVERLALAFTSARAYLAAAAFAMLLLLAAFGRPLMSATVDEAHVDLAWWALVMTIVPTALTLPLRVYPSALAGLSRLDVVGSLQALCAVALLAGVWAGFRAGMELPGFSLAMTIGSLLPLIPSWLLARRLLPRGALRFTRIDFALFRELVAYSVNTLIYAMGTVVLYQTMKFIAAWRFGVAAAGEISLAISIVQTLAVVFVPLFTTLFARFGQLHGSGQSDAMRDLLSRALATSGLLVIPGSAFLFACADGIFRAWVGNELGQEAIAEVVWTTRLMLLGQAAYVLVLPCYNALLGMGEHRSFGIGMLITAVANAGCGWIISGWFPEIATLAWVFSAALAALVLLVTVPLARARFGLALRPLFVRAVLVPLAASVPGVALVLWGPDLQQPIPDLALDAILFAIGAAPGLEWARRRFVRAGS